MTSFTRFSLVAVKLILAVFVAVWTATAHAETFPDRTVRIIVGQGTGATSDIIARLVAAKLQEIWSVPVVVEGHSGAAGTIAASMVAKAAPDGYTLLLASSTNLAMATVTGESISYDPVKDFAPMGRIAKIPWALAARAKLPANSIGELTAYSKAHPGQLKGSSTGPGSSAAFGIDMLNRKTGSDILNVPYRANAAQIQAVLAEEVDIVFTDVSILAPHVKAGTVKLLAAAGSKRLRAFPDLPTLDEQGVGEIVLDPWYGLVAPAGTPAPIVAKLCEGLTKALRAPDMRKHILDFGYEPIDETPAEFAGAIAADIARFSATAPKAGH
jgi:tripartite-type tricarboxylate transporter receptor subunit TctC